MNMLLDFCLVKYFVVKLIMYNQLGRPNLCRCVNQYLYWLNVLLDGFLSNFLLISYFEINPGLLD